MAASGTHYLRIVWRRCYWALPCILLAISTLSVPHTEGPDLLPTPDAMEYTMLTHRLASFEPPLIELGGADYPSRYSLTFPLMLVPVGWIFGSSLHMYYWGAWFYSLLAAGFFAVAAAKLLRSRWGGTLAATFWVLHPQTLWSAIHLMRDNTYTLGFALTVLLLIPLIRGTSKRASLRWVLLGLLTGYLTVGFTPWAFWGAAVAVWMILNRGARDVWKPLGIFVGSAAIPYAADLVYRKWAFGSFGMNGYKFWAPEIYNHLNIVFNPRYIMYPFSPEAAESGNPNLRYYAESLLGHTAGFYGRPFAACIFVSTGLMAWLSWRRSCWRWWYGTLLCWGVAGLAFCLLYFFQSERFVQFWIYLADLVVAGALVEGWRRIRRHQPAMARPGITRLACGGIVVILTAGLIYGETKRIMQHPEFWELPNPGPQRVDLLKLIELVPEGVPLYANYELAVLDIERKDGPNGALYVHPSDGWQNGHAYALYAESPEPHRSSHARDWPPLMLIDPEGQWIPEGESVRKLFSQPVYILLSEPVYFRFTIRHVRKNILPKVLEHSLLESIQSAGDMALYRTVPRADEALNQPGN